MPILCSSFHSNNFFSNNLALFSFSLCFILSLFVCLTFNQVTAHLCCIFMAHFLTADDHLGFLADLGNIEGYGAKFFLNCFVKNQYYLCLPSLLLIPP